MQKLYSQCIGLQVIEAQTRSRLGLVSDILIDPETGKLIGFIINNKYIIVPMDIEHLNKSLIVLEKDRIVPLAEVIRAQRIYKSYGSLIGSKVMTEKQKEYLGRLIDYSFDTSHLSLISIHTAKQYLFLHLNERIISAKDIIKIEKRVVTVRDIHATEFNEEVKTTSSALAT